MLGMITSKSKMKQASRNQVGLTFGVGLTLKVLSSKWGLLSRVGLTIEWAYYRINMVYHANNRKCFGTWKILFPLIQSFYQAVKKKQINMTKWI